MTGLQILPLIFMGLTDILRHKLRSFLTMLGVVFGVGSVVGNIHSCVALFLLPAAQFPAEPVPETGI